MQNRINLSIAIAGAVGTASQIILMREFFDVFYGNELSMALVLGIWLVFGAIGSMVGRGGFKDDRGGPFLFGVLQAVLAAVFPLSILAARSIKPIFGVMPGQLIGVWPLVMAALLILSPICIISGYLFRIACVISGPGMARENTGRAFFLESVGSAAGGLVVSLVLIRFFKSLELAPIVSLVNLTGAYIAASCLRGRRGRGFILKGAVVVSAAALIFFYSTGWFAKLDRVSLERKFPDFELVSDKTSIYGNIVVVKKGGQISLFNNGVHCFSYPDRYTQEETVHFPMLMAKNPKRVLLLGGGAGGALEELLKYPVERIDYVELDPAIIEESREALKDYGPSWLDNEKVHISNIDARLFIRRSRTKYDVVIIALPNPYTAEINRFYTREFYADLSGILNEGGIASFSSTSSESYIGGELARFLSSLYKTAKGVFSDVSIVPGNRAIFLLSDYGGAADLGCKTIMDRLSERGIKTIYMRDYYLASRLSQENMDYLKSRLDETKGISVNLDYAPISYYYDLVLWSSYFKGAFFSVIKNLRPEWIWPCIITLLSIFLLASINAGLKSRAMCAISISGFTQISFEIIIILVFQIIYGYVYTKIGLIVTFFMGGLGLGSFAITKALNKIKNPAGPLRYLFMSSLLLLVFTAALISMVKGARSSIVYALGDTAISSILPLVSGLIGGAIFPLVNRIYLDGLEETLDISRSGMVYGIDLLGSGIGAVLTGSIFIPILGIYQTLAILAALNLSALILLHQRT